MKLVSWKKAGRFDQLSEPKGMSQSVTSMRPAAFLIVDNDDGPTIAQFSGARGPLFQRRAR